MILILLKIFVTLSVIIGLSLIAEHVSPKLSGLLSGYPLGAAIALFFLGYEISPEFAAESSRYTLLGLISSQVLVYTYYIISKKMMKFNILPSSLGAIAAFFCTSSILDIIPIEKGLILPVTCVATLLFIYALRHVKNSPPPRNVVFSLRSVFIRACFAAAVILLITGSAKIVGQKWAGLFSAFPATLFPLLLIIHFSHGVRPAHTIIKNFPKGLGSLIIYTISVHYLYPATGLYTGTALAFCCATLYLAFILKLPSLRRRYNNRTPSISKTSS